MALQQPTIIPEPWADQGSRVSIPDTTTEGGRASWSLGFPPETAMPLGAGGIPPNWLDFQGVLHALSQHIVFEQAGGRYVWSNALDYPIGACIIGSDNKVYQALQISGPGTTSGAKNPTTSGNSAYWGQIATPDGSTIKIVNGKLTADVVTLAAALADGTTITANNGKLTSNAGSDIYVNAKDYGAVDARTSTYTDAVLVSNAAAVQDAIDYAETHGGTVYIPNGYKYLRSEIDDKGLLILDDSNGVRVTSQDYWWRPGIAPGGVKQIAHRGLSAVYPENTLLAFKAAALEGYHGIETDIEWTSDGYPICMHDTTVDRTTDGTGNVYDLTLAEIRALDAGSWLNSAFASTRVPTFEEYLDCCAQFGKAPWIELKTHNNVTASRLHDLIDAVTAYGLADTAVFLAFKWSYLDAVRAYSKKVGVCGLIQADLTDAHKQQMQWWGGRAFWAPSTTYLAAESIAALRACGIATYGWTIAEAYSLNTARTRLCPFVAVNTRLEDY